MLKSAPFVIFWLILAFFAYILISSTSQKRISKMPDTIILCSIDDKNECIVGKDFKGNAYIVHFFSTWCHSCFAWHSFWKEVSEYFDVYGILWKDTEISAKQWLKAHDNDYKMIFGDFSGSLGDKFGVDGIPETFVFDKESNLLLHFKGVMDRDIWKHKLLSMIKSN